MQNKWVLPLTFLCSFLVSSIHTCGNRFRGYGGYIPLRPYPQPIGPILQPGVNNGAGSSVSLEIDGTNLNGLLTGGTTGLGGLTNQGVNTNAQLLQLLQRLGVGNNAQVPTPQILSTMQQRQNPMLNLVGLTGLNQPSGLSGLSGLGGITGHNGLNGLNRLNNPLLNSAALTQGPGGLNALTQLGPFG